MRVWAGGNWGVLSWGPVAPPLAAVHDGIGARWGKKMVVVGRNHGE